MASRKTLADTQLTGRDRRAVKAAAKLLRSHFPVAEIVLFGSKVRGDDDPESDIDLLVLTTEQLSQAQRNAVTDLLFDVQLEHDVVLSTVVVAADEWDHGIFQALPIHDDILEEGVLV